MSIYEDNLALIEGRFSGFRKDISERYTPAEGLEVSTTPAGPPTVRVEGVYLHSRHNPLREAARLAETTLDGREDCIIVEGLGLGYGVEALLETAPGVPLLIVEPDIPLFLGLLSVRSMEVIFSNPSVSLFTGADPEAVIQLLSGAGYTSVKVVRNRVLSRLYGDYFDRVEAALSLYLARKEVNRNTLKRFGKTWVRNLARNLPVLGRARGTDRLEGLFRGIPALLLAAGPSVEEILPFLEELRTRFVIAAVDTTARLLFRRGISPDILVVVDPQYWNTRHLDGVTFEHTVLVSESSTHPRVFRSLNLPVFFGGSIFPLGKFLEGYTGIRGKLGAGGSVATSAWDILRRAGCSEIFCAGLDLGFPGLRTHFRGSRFEHFQLSSGHRLGPAEGAAYHALRDADPFYTENYAGGQTLTDRRLIIYRGWFEGQFKTHPDPPTFTLSRGGVKLEGMRYRPPGQLENYPGRRREIDAALSSVVNSEYPETPSGEHLLRGVEDLILALSHLEDLAGRGLREAETAGEKHLRGEDIKAELQTLDDIDRRILSSGSKDIAGFLMQDFISRVSSSGETAGGASALDDSADMYRRLEEAASYHRRLLREAAERMGARQD